MSKETGLQKSVKTDAALANAIMMWADSTTDAQTNRRHDLLRDKHKAVEAFFESINKHPEEVRPLDVKKWQKELEMGHLVPATIYAKISRLSSFYEWIMNDPNIAGRIRSNPVSLARPKAPKAYQSESTQALDDDVVKKLLNTIKAKADGGDVVGKRDYALLLFYLTTGMRRSEVIGLRWGDLKINGSIVITGRVKGGNYVVREVGSSKVRDALLKYFTASGRKTRMKPKDPLWTRHDKGGEGGKPLTSHAFAKNLKRYSKEAGIGDIHIHQTRHTFARIVAEDTGSIIETQDALDHKNLATTKVYVQRIGVKRDKYSEKISERFGL